MKTSFEFPEPDSKQDIENFARLIREEIDGVFRGQREAVPVYRVASFAEEKIKEIMIREKWVKREDLY
jgi:hypothetical protein